MSVANTNRVKATKIYALREKTQTSTCLTIRRYIGHSKLSQTMRKTRRFSEVVKLDLRLLANSNKELPNMTEL